MDNNELLHFGILGMKWGIRRYQNSDGTLTEDGKKRYGRLGSDKNNLRRVDKTAMRRASSKIVYFGTRDPGPNQKKVLESYKKEANNTKYEKDLNRMDKQVEKLRNDYTIAKKKGDDSKIEQLEFQAQKLLKEYNDAQIKNSVESMQIAQKYVRSMNNALVKDLDFEYTKLGADYLTKNRLGWTDQNIYNRAWFNDKK